MSKNKIASLSLITVLTLMGVAGCSEEGVTGEVSDVGRGPTDAYEEEITVTAVLNDVFGRNAQPFTDSAWGNEFLEKLNIRLEVEANIPGANYNERMNTLVASGSLPDIFRIDTPTMYEELVEDDLLYDLTDIYNEFATDELKAFSEANEGYAIDGLFVDERLYGVPVAGNERAMRPVVYMRKDWLEELNLEVPETIDEIWEVAEAFKDNDIGGNGTLGIPLDNDLLMLRGILSSYGHYLDAFHENTSGELEYTSIADGMEDALRIIAEKYQEGIIDPEFVTKDREKVYEDIKADRIGIWFDDVNSNMRVVQELYESSNVEAEFLAISIPDTEGNIAKQSLPTRAGNIWVVNKNAQNPEALLKLMNFTINKWNTLETEEEFDTFNYNNPSGQDGYTGFPIGGIPEATLRWAKQQEYYDETGEFSEELLTDKEEKSRILSVEKYRENPEEYSQFRYYAFQNSSEGHSPAVANYEEADAYMIDYYQGLGSETYISSKPILDTTESDYFIGIITGDRDPESFSEFREYWLSNGGQDILDELNEWFSNSEF